MIRLLADENIVGLSQLPTDEVTVTAVPGRQLSRSQLVGFDALWVRSVTRVDEALLAGSSLRFVGTATAGVEHIDQAALKDRGIAFAAAPGSNANAVVEYVLAAMAQLGDPWERLEQGAVLGVVGYGEVGRRLVAFARAMGWSVKVHDPWYLRAVEHSVSAGEAERSGSDAGFCSLDELLEATVISLHSSLHKREPWPSYHLLDARALGKLSSAQWLINAARGPVIDNAALLTHLRGTDPVNCILDVWEGEPAFEAKLLAQPALRLATPHIAGYSWDAKLQATRMLYDAMRERRLVRAPLAVAGEDRSPDIRPVPVSGGSSERAGLRLMRGLLDQRYRISEDDARFRALADLAPDARAEGFDRLRKEYPRRRELRGSSLVPDYKPGSAEAGRLFRALGLQWSD